jgi:membrane-bound ClpP family serine protease
MSLVVLFFLVGVILLALELVVPGAILGIVGGISMLAGVIAAFTIFGGSGGALATLVALVVLGLAVYLEFIWLPKSRLAKGLSMSTTIEATSQPPLAKGADVIGREALTQTVLSPSGYVLVDGRRYEAYSQSGHIAAGERLKVVSLDNFRLIVTKT